MKRDRQAVIKQMISRDKIGTQEEIKQRLEAEGITVTQATLSRDLREIGLLKLRDEEGKLYYSLSEHVKADSTSLVTQSCLMFWPNVTVNFGPYG